MIKDTTLKPGSQYDAGGNTGLEPGSNPAFSYDSLRT